MNDLGLQDVGTLVADGSGLSVNGVDVATLVDGNMLNEQQTLSVRATGGGFTLTFEGQTTAVIAVGSDASIVEARLESLSTIGTGNVKVTKSDVGPAVYTIEFVKGLAGTDVEHLIVDPAQLTGVLAVRGGNAVDLESLVNLGVTTTTLNAVFPVDVSPAIAGLPSAGGRIDVGVSDLFSGDAPQVSATNNLLDFSNITPDEVIPMLEQVAKVLADLGASNMLNLRIPLVQGRTVGELLDFELAFKEAVLDPLFVSGNSDMQDNDSDGGEAPIKGTSKGTAIEFSFTVAGPMGDAVVTYTGTVEGDTMGGSMKMGDLAGGPFTGKKQ